MISKIYNFKRKRSHLSQAVDPEYFFLCNLDFISYQKHFIDEALFKVVRQMAFVHLFNDCLLLEILERNNKHLLDVSIFIRHSKVPQGLEKFQFVTDASNFLVHVTGL